MEQFLGLDCLTEIISAHWLTEKQSKKTVVGVEYICSPDHPGQSPRAGCSLLGREGSQEAGTGPGEGAGKSDGTDGDLSSHVLNSTGRSLTAACLLRRALLQQPFFQAPARQGHVSCWGACQWRWAAAARRRQSDCMVSLSHPCHSPKHVSPSTAIPVCAAGTCVFPEIHQRGLGNFSRRFLSRALISSKLSLCQWPQMNLKQGGKHYSKFLWKISTSERAQFS